MDIKEAKTVLKAQLAAYAGLTALVPATRMVAGYPNSLATLPMISFSEEDSFNTDADRFDNQPIADTSVMEINIWVAPNTSATPIFKQLNACMELNGWNRDGAVDLVDPDTKNVRKFCRYSNVLYR